MGKTVFTNGCFDIIHAGHIALLEQARSFGDKLIVGLNSDESVRSIKGPDRPINSESDRAFVLLGLSSVDEVKIFNQLTPEELIKEIKPDVLVKGGDWNVDEIIGAEFVKSIGGEVYSIPLKEGYSSSKIIERSGQNDTEKHKTKKFGSAREIAQNALEMHIDVFENVIKEQIENISICGEIIFESVSQNNKLLICGNGGSAADAQHIAAEFVGRYETERKALASVALTTDTSALTAISNDYGFERVYSRQVEALAKEGDVLLAISTSGNSPNIIKAIMTARKMGCKVIGLTGQNGKKLAALCDACVMVSAEKTSRIQEAHITIGHIWCELVDSKLNTL